MWDENLVLRDDNVLKEKQKPSWTCVMSDDYWTRVRVGGESGTRSVEKAPRYTEDNNKYVRRSAQKVFEYVYRCVN